MAGLYIEFTQINHENLSPWRITGHEKLRHHLFLNGGIYTTSRSRNRSQRIRTPKKLEVYQCPACVTSPEVSPGPLTIAHHGNNSFVSQGSPCTIHNSSKIDSGVYFPVYIPYLYYCSWGQVATQTPLTGKPRPFSQNRHLTGGFLGFNHGLSPSSKDNRRLKMQREVQVSWFSLTSFYDQKTYHYCT